MNEFFDEYNDLYQANPKSYRVFLEGVTEVISRIALYITLAVVAALIVWAVVVRNRDEQYLKGVRRTMLGIVVGYTVGVIAVLGSLRLYAEILAEHFTWHAWLILGLFVLLAIAVIVNIVWNKNGKRKWLSWCFAAVIAVYVVVLLVLVKPVEQDYAPQQGWLMYLISALLVIAIAVLALVGSKPSGSETKPLTDSETNSNSSYETKSLTYAAICIAMSFALSYVKFFSLPQGGSVTFASLLPLALYSYMFGTRKGVLAGVVYGLLQFVQSPQYYQTMQVLLDYPIAFGAIGLAGLGRNFKFLKGNTQLEFVFGATIAVLFRYVAHVLSGYFVFYTWAEWAGYSNALLYSLIYNTYTLVDLIVMAVVGVVALSSKTLKRLVLTANATPRVSATNNQ